MNTNIKNIHIVNTPEKVISKYLVNHDDYNFISKSRETIKNILDGKDSRLLVVVGPCSIHNYNSALEYAHLLSQQTFKNLFIVMRVYFEKPRTSVGWKGFIYDPDLDGSNNINKGLDLARRLLVEITKLRIPIGVEFLDTITPQYLADLVSWGAIGARTTESQIHRQLASGLSMPIGFKNLTDGNIEKAVNGIKSANLSHTFLGIDHNGTASIVETTGNTHAHLILRGGSNKPNYDLNTISSLPHLNKKFIVDCSHDNSCKNYKRQVLVALYIMRLKMLKGLNIGGIMLESNLCEGRQDLSEHLTYGVSVTDPCLSWDTTHTLLHYMDNIENIQINTLEDARKLIEYYDNFILNSNLSLLSIKFTDSDFITNFDNELIDLNLDNYHNAVISTRLAISDKIADFKFKLNPELFLKKSNNILEEITKISLEENIIKKFSNKPFVHKILDISKKIQCSSIEKHLQNTKIGYLFGKGTFSWEAVNLLRGQHLSYNNVDELYSMLEEYSIDFAIVPIYNIKIGTIYVIPERFKEILRFSIPIRLSIYANKSSNTYDTLYIEPHVDKEIDTIQIKYNTKVYCNSTRDGVLKILNSISPSITVASSNLDNPLLYKLDDIPYDSNRTYFSLIKL